MDEVTLTVVFEPVEDGSVQARIVELPAVITAAPSRDEARELIVDALREYLLAQGEPHPLGESEPLTLQRKLPA